MDSLTDQPETWRGSESLRPLLVPIDSVQLDPKNARRHPQRNLEAIAESIVRFGQLKPIVIWRGRILAGNGTHTVIAALDWTHIARVEAPPSMTEQEAIAFAIADNRTGDLAEWDLEELNARFEEIPNELLDFTGFSRMERAAMRTTAPENGDEPKERKKHPRSITFSDEQWEIVTQAIERVKEADVEPDSLTPQRAIELVCADFLSGT